MAPYKKQIIYKDGKDTGEAELPEQGIPAWVGQQGLIGFGETLGSTFPTIYGLSGAVKDYLYDRSDPTVSPNTSFSDYFLDPNGGKEKFEAYNNKVIEDIKAYKPDASPEEVQRQFQSIQKHSKKYHDETTPFYRSGIAFSRKWNAGVNEALGDPRLPQEKTQSDQLLNFAGGAAIPIPGGVVGKATGAIGAKIVANPIGRFAVNVAEVSTPATIAPKGATAGQWATRYGFNVGVPEVADQATRIYKDEPSFVGDAAAEIGMPFKKDDGSANLTAIGGAGVAATVIGGLVTRRVLRNIPSSVPPGGPTTSAMQEAVNPTVNSYRMKAAEVGSDIGPAEFMSRQMGNTPEVAERYSTRLNNNSATVPLADHQLWEQDRLTRVFQPFVQKDPQAAEKFFQHVNDANRLHGEARSIREVDTALHFAEEELTNALRAGNNANPQNTRYLLDKVNELKAERQARATDSDPNLRFMNVNEPRADVVARYRQSRADPMIQAMEKEVVKLKHELIDVAYNNGSISLRSAQYAKSEVAKGAFGLTENPLAQQSWLKQKWGDVKKTSELHLLNADPIDAMSVYRLVNNPRYRKGYINANGHVRYSPAPGYSPQQRVNNANNIIQELQNTSIRIRQAAANNRNTKEYFEMMMASPKNAPVSGNRKYLDIVDRIPEHKVPKELDKYLANISKRYKGQFLEAFLDRGDLVIFRHNEKTIHNMLKFSPASVIPVFNQVRKMSQWMATGPITNPTWFATAAPWDVMMAAIARNPDMAMGVLGKTTMQLLGRDNKFAQLISSALSGPDAAINFTTRLPYHLVKNGLVELLGNQLGKRWQMQLQSNSGVVGQIAKLPGGQQLIQTASDAMVKAYQNSQINAVKMMKVGHVGGWSEDLLSHLRKVDDLSKKQPLLKPALNTLKAMLTTLNDSAKTMMLSQNLKLYKSEMAKGVRQAQHMSEDYIAKQTRLIGGDMARVTGNVGLQRFLSIFPFGNQMQQGIRYMSTQAYKNPTHFFTRMTSLGLTVMGTYHLLSQNERASNEFWNELPNDQRAGVVPIPNPLRYAQRMMGMDIPQGSLKEEFFLVRMPPEMLLFMSPLVAGMRAFGLIDDKKAVAPAPFLKDMGHAVEATFGLSMPPPLQAIAGGFGMKIEPGKALSGDNPFQKIRESSMAGGNKDKMSPQSRIPHVYHDIFNGLLTTVASDVMKAYDYGDITAKITGSAAKGVKEGVKKLAVDRAARVPHVAAIWPEVNKNYIYTPIRESYQNDMKIQEAINEQMRNEPGLRRAMHPNTRINSNERVGADENAVIGGTIRDPDVAALVAMNNKIFFSGAFVKLEEQRRLERKKHEAYTVGVVPGQSPLQRFKLAQEQAKKVNHVDHEAYNLRANLWKQMESSPSGLAFAERYGPLTPENLLKAMRATSQGPRQ